MKTKEHILKNHGVYEEEDGILKKVILTGDWAIKALDEYAKQTSIAFDKWKREHGYTIDFHGQCYVKLIVKGNDATTIDVPIDEVYTQFIEHQNKTSQ